MGRSDYFCPNGCGKKMFHTKNIGHYTTKRGVYKCSICNFTFVGLKHNFKILVK